MLADFLAIALKIRECRKRTLCNEETRKLLNQAKNFQRTLLDMKKIIFYYICIPHCLSVINDIVLLIIESYNGGGGTVYKNGPRQCNKHQTMAQKLIAIELIHMSYTY
jgi:hypothetical protein